MATTLAEPPIDAMTRALAGFQTAIDGAGLAVFAGDLDRFAIFALILARTHRDLPDTRPITANSLALSMVRPFETMRRHVNALIARGLCHRVKGGAAVVDDVLDDGAIAAMIDTLHDAFVEFVDHLAGSGLLPPVPPPARPYRPLIGVDAAINIMFEWSENNRPRHHDWLSLSVFSAIVHANAELYRRFAPLGGVPLRATHAVRLSVVARMLNLPHTTIRRRVAILTRPGGPVVRCPEGLLVSIDRLGEPAAVAAVAAAHAAVRRTVARAAVNGFPFHDPASVYRVGPAAPRLD